MLPIVTDWVVWSVSRLVFRSVTVVTLQKGLNRSRCHLCLRLGPVGLSTWMGSRKHVLGGMHTGATWQIPLNCPCDAAMQPVIKLLWSLVINRLLCSITYIDAAYCYRRSSVVCLSVTWSVCHDPDPCKNSLLQNLKYKYNLIWMFLFFMQGMPRRKDTGKHRMRQLEFVESPPLNTPWRPTTPSRSCLCPVTADVVGIDQAGHDWVSNFCLSTEVSSVLLFIGWLSSL